MLIAATKTGHPSHPGFAQSFLFLLPQPLPASQNAPPAHRQKYRPGTSPGFPDIIPGILTLPVSHTRQAVNPDTGRIPAYADKMHESAPALPESDDLPFHPRIVL